MFNDNILRFIYCYHFIDNKYKYLELYDYKVHGVGDDVIKKWRYYNIRIYNPSKIENLNYYLYKLDVSISPILKIENLNDSLHTLNISNTYLLK